MSAGAVWGGARARLVWSAHRGAGGAGGESGGRGEVRAAALHVALISVLRRVARFGQCVQARGGSSKSRPRFQSKGELAGRAYRQGGEADEGAGGGGECLAVALRLYAPTLSASVVVWRWWECAGNAWGAGVNERMMRL